jgi:hypothetical protein
MLTAQFISAAPGCGAAGKNKKINPKLRNRIAMVLTGYPHTPKLNFEAGNSSRRIRLASTQAIQVIYCRQKGKKVSTCLR